MMRDIDELLPEVLTFAPNCPELLAYRFIRQAAQKLLRRTKLWRESDDWTLTAPDAEAICSIPDAQIFEIENAFLDGHKLTPVTPEWLDRERPDWQWSYDENAGPADYITQLNPLTITVVPKATGTLKARLILLPSRSALTVPDFLVEQYAEVIGKGAAGEILRQPDPEFANPVRGGELTAEFMSTLDTLAHAAHRSQVGAPPRTRGNWF